MKTLTAGKTAGKLLWLYAALITTVLLLLIVQQKIPQKILWRFTRQQPISQSKHWPLEPINNPHFQSKVAVFNLLSTKDKVVFLGNSLTENCNWNEVLQSDKIANRGIGGDKSAGILIRIDSYLKDKPHCIVLMDGINDILQGVLLDSTILNYKTTIDKVLAAHVPLIVQSTFFVAKTCGNGTIEPTSINQAVSKLNAAVRQYCKNKGIVYVDVNSQLEQEGFMPADYTISDGLHLSNKAYKKWKEIIQPIIINY